MRLWQKTMITLARSAPLRDFMQDSRLARPFTGVLSRQFTGGDDAKTALHTARNLQAHGIGASLFFMGEYVDTPELVRENMDALLEALPMMAQHGVQMHVSVDPTQIGSMLSWKQCRNNALRLAEALAQHAASSALEMCPALMLDMEDAGVTEKTLEVYHALRDKELPVAITLQAYLHRSEEDLLRLIERGAFIRLVKGAFAEPATIAQTGRKERDNAYKRMLGILFSPEAKARGVYPALGTHDHTIIDYARTMAEARGWRPGEWEVEMLHGVRPGLQQELVAQGVAVRVYLPFGRQWWPYSIRRIGETPRNLGFVLRALGTGKMKQPNMNTSPKAHE